jgi:hypothetical protein
MSALRDSHKRLQIEYNSRPIRDANLKKKIKLTFLCLIFQLILLWDL